MNLSGGQIQKLGLAAILAMQPELILLDEPTANLDPVATRSVHAVVRGLRDAGMTVLLVTRELDDFLAQADQILVLEDGRVFAAGDPYQVLRESGQRMVDSLGIWLPETAEIGLALRQSGRFKAAEIPIRVEEALDLLRDNRLLAEVITGVDASATSQPGAVLISARDLTYTYPGGIQALKGVSFEIRAGEMLAIVGRNGAGKAPWRACWSGCLKRSAASCSFSAGLPASGR